MTEAETIAQTPQDAPITQSSLVRDLRALGLQPGSTVIVHSSLSKFGWVAGGAVAVIQALEEVITSAGTLVMPAHSGDLSEPSYWVAPPVPESWWPIIRAEMSVYQPDLTPTREMGVIAETFRKQQGVLRSAHPHHSFTAWGAQCEWITARHSLSNGLSEESPLARIYDLDGWVLLLGVTHANNTSLHLAEYRRSGPKEMERQGAPLSINGERRWVECDTLAIDSDDFAALGEDYERETGAVARGRVGCADGRLMRQRPLVDYAVQWMQTHRQPITA